jgi:site-specific DNA-methyltransferase (adenine-specific)
MATLTLYKGDCLEVMKDISSNSIDLIICDLPYGVLATQPRSEESIKKYQRTAKDGGGNACGWDVKIDLVKFWEQAKRILKNEHCPVIHFCTTKFGYELIKSNESWFRYDLVWDKQRGVSFLSANKMPMRSHEMIYVFSKAGAYYNRIDIKSDKGEWNKVPDSVRIMQVYTNEMKRTTSHGEAGKRCPLSVINIKQLSSYQMKGGHPTEKPVSLYRWLIERYCPPDGTVLDPTFGSGNSVFTALEMGRHAIGIEKDDKFYEKAEQKLNTIE